MKIDLKGITVRELFNGYMNNEEEGVVGYDGKLNIRPKYQREFVYKEEQKKSVINSLIKKFPLNVMYWVERKNGDEVFYEILDGQQRTMSICEYLSNNFSVEANGKNYLFDGLSEYHKDLQNQILDYELMVYFCNGEDDEILEWFEVINTVGEKLTDQELRNAIYTGEWLTDAKRYFSKTGCGAQNIGNKYITADPIRQGYLETAIKWIAEIKNDEPRKDKKIKEYMALHQRDANAKELWTVYEKIINWITEWFPDYYKPMKSVDWGFLYSQCKDRKYTDDDRKTDISRIRDEVETLMKDDDVGNKKGIYEYVLLGNENVLNIRCFTENQKEKKYKEQNGICVKCQQAFEIDDMEADHIIPWSKGGKTVPENCQVLCKKCNGTKSNR